jgi:selenocysteine lyase/cysteine desulfurase
MMVRPKHVTRMLHGTVKSFGSCMKKQFFEDDNVHINNGSWGATPKRIIEAKHRYEATMESNTDKWFRVTAPRLYDETRICLAKFINASYQDIALIDNVSYGLNSVLRSHPFICSSSEPCTIMYYNTSYMALKQLLYYLRDTFPHVQLLQVDLNHQSISHQDLILEQTERMLKSDLNVRIAIVDHISATPSIVFPVKELSTLFRKHGVQTIVDGAHAVGQVPVDIQDLNVDYYVSNCHKWCYSARPSGFLWISPIHNNKTRPAVMSFGYTDRNFKEEFYFSGTKDWSAIFTIKDAITWREEIGGEKEIMVYCTRLADRTGKFLAEEWKTQVLKGKTAAMVNVLLPVQDKEKAEQIAQNLFENHKCYIHRFEFDGKFYARISCQIYNDEKEMESFGLLVKNAIKSE